MQLTKETKWLCENATELEKFSGQWVAFNVRQGVTVNGLSFVKTFSASKKVRATEKSFVFHVPSKDELGSPLVY